MQDSVLFHKRQGCSWLVIRILPFPTFIEVSLMSAKIYVNFPQGQFLSQLTQSNMTHSDLQQYIRYQCSRGHLRELQVINVLVAKFTETDLHYITVIMC